MTQSDHHQSDPYDNAESSPDDDGTGSRDRAVVVRRRRWRLSPVWLVPLAAILIGAWLLYDNVASQGPEITLKIDDASGIKAGETEVKVHSVAVGQVTRVRLADDHQGAVLSVQMNPNTGDLLAANDHFWLVKARIGRQGISGLGTIISGAYIQLQPGDAKTTKHEFTIRDSAPALSTNKPGITVKLYSSSDASLAVGDPILYKGQTVGQIEAANFSVPQKRMNYRIFVRKPFAQLVTDKTQFWLRSGVSFHLGSNGVDVKLGSLQSVLAGGITFGRPKDIEPGKKASNGATYRLYEDHDEAVQNRFDQRIEYVILMDDSVRGLSSGAPVEYRGLRVGTVEQVPFYRGDFKLRSFSNFKIPVLIAIEPQRPALQWAHWTPQQWRQHNHQFFAHGMRATIKSSNLLTGQMFINLTFDHNAPKWHQEMIGRYEVFPSEPSQITSLQQQLSNLMDKLNQIDPGPIADQIKQTFATTRDTLDQLNQTVHKINNLLDKPGTQKLPGNLSDTLKSIQQTLDGLQQGSPAYRQIGQSIDRLDQILENIAPLSRTLRDHPNALIFGRPNGKDPEPRAKP